MRPPSLHSPARLLALAGGLLVAAALAIAAPAAAIAPDELRELREAVLALEDRVAAQQRRIDDQERALREAEAAERRGSASGLSDFLARTDFQGWVAASYFWNFNNPRSPQAGGNGPFSNPYHADHNSFQLDEAWFVASRPATRESPAGFHFEVTFGATATAFAQTVSSCKDTDNDGNIDTCDTRGNLNGNDIWVPAANVSYRTAAGPTLVAGKFNTLIGYEEPGAARNAQITRGLTFTLFQPVSHTGVKLEQKLDGGFEWAVAMVNGFGNEQPNTNNGMGYLARVGWSNDVASVQLNGFYTNKLEGPGGDRWLADAVLELHPHERVVLWANADYINTEIDSANPWGVGLSVGARVAVANGFHLAVRGEYARFRDQGAGTFVDATGVVRPLDGDLWSLTGTLDRALTESLVAKVEAKVEKADDDLQGSFKEGRSGTASHAVFVGSQLYYAF